ncbi:MAG: LAGLIDADG family homing endonuclease [Candidatus ainarchaeum sp.]|nr:LAGLIDADG family homing endonuclease [Candidatus ainarchaeum sp.]
MEFLEKSCGGDYYLLAKKLGISYPFVICLRKSEYSIPKKILIKISDLANFELSNVENNIEETKTRAGLSLKTQFPIEGDETIASLVGHVFGDGFISSKKRQFEYSNKNPFLLSEVETLIQKRFEIGPYTRKKERIGYPAVFGGLLLLFGAPKAPKIFSKKTIPDWIMLGNNTCKKAFLKAIFDDDGSVMYSKSFNAKGVNLYQTRHESCAKNLSELLNQTKKLLEEFGIKTGNPLISRGYIKKDGKHVVMYINITDQHSIVNFYNNIGLCCGKKFSKLEKLATKNLVYTKYSENEFKQKILDYLKTDSASTSTIAKELKHSAQKTLKKLKQLEAQNKVKRIGKIATNRATIWKIMEATAY